MDGVKPIAVRLDTSMSVFRTPSGRRYKASYDLESLKKEMNGRRRG